MQQTRTHAPVHWHINVSRRILHAHVFIHRHMCPQTQPCARNHAHTLSLFHSLLYIPSHTPAHPPSLHSTSTSNERSQRMERRERRRVKRERREAKGLCDTLLANFRHTEKQKPTHHWRRNVWPLCGSTPLLVDTVLCVVQAQSRMMYLMSTTLHFRLVTKRAAFKQLSVSEQWHK